MMKIVLFNAVEIFIGLSSGLIIGSAFIALLTFLGIIPRLIQLSQSSHLINIYSIPLVTGTLIGTYFTFMETSFSVSLAALSIWGLIHGVFNGMLAAALVEVLNVFPILSRRAGIERHIRLLLMAVVFGKIFGSLFQWLYFSK